MLYVDLICTPDGDTAIRQWTGLHSLKYTVQYGSLIDTVLLCDVDRVWNVMAHAQKPDFVFRRNGRVQLNRRRRQLSRLLAAELCSSAVVMLDTPCSEVVWSVLATHSILQFPAHFLSRASPCAITLLLDSTYVDTHPDYKFVLSIRLFEETMYF